jgi:hypothetical protein
MAMPTTSPARTRPLDPIQSCSNACLRKKPTPRNRSTAPTRESQVPPSRPSHCPTPEVGRGLGTPRAPGCPAATGSSATLGWAGAGAGAPMSGAGGATGVSRTCRVRGASGGEAGGGVDSVAPFAGTADGGATSPAGAALRCSSSARRSSSRRRRLLKLRIARTRMRTMIGVAKKRRPSATSGTIGRPVMFTLDCHHSAGAEWRPGGQTRSDRARGLAACRSGARGRRRGRQVSSAQTVDGSWRRRRRRKAPSGSSMTSAARG